MRVDARSTPTAQELEQPLARERPDLLALFGGNFIFTSFGPPPPAATGKRPRVISKESCPQDPPTCALALGPPQPQDG